MKMIFATILGLLLNTLAAEETALSLETKKIEGVLEEKLIELLTLMWV